MRRVKVVRQRDAMQCGVACLSMICGWHGERLAAHRRPPTGGVVPDRTGDRHPLRRAKFLSVRDGAARPWPRGRDRRPRLADRRQGDLLHPRPEPAQARLARSAGMGVCPALLPFAQDRAPLDAEHRGSISFASVPEIFISVALYYSVLQSFENSMPEIFFWNIQNPAVTLHSETLLCCIPRAREATETQRSALRAAQSKRLLRLSGFVQTVRNRTVDKSTNILTIKQLNNWSGYCGRLWYGQRYVRDMNYHRCPSQCLTLNH